MERDQIAESIRSAYLKLLSNDMNLFSVDANERSITHKLAEYLQAEFTDWNVDCEYNRNGLAPKKLSTFVREVKSDNTDAISVYPDIIVHRRGTSESFIVIEAKKSNSQAKDLDDKKLCAYKNDLSYKYAYKVTFPIGTDKKPDPLSDIQEIDE